MKNFRKINKLVCQIVSKIREICPILKNRYLFNFVLFLIIKFKYIRKKKRTLYGIIKHQKFNAIDGYKVKITHVKSGKIFTGLDLKNNIVKIIPE